MCFFLLAVSTQTAIIHLDHHSCHEHGFLVLGLLEVGWRFVHFVVFPTDDFYCEHCYYDLGIHDPIQIKNAFVQLFDVQFFGKPRISELHLVFIKEVQSAII